MSQTVRTAEQQAARYDELHSGYDPASLSAGLFVAAFGDQYPAEADPNSMCTWSVVGEMVARLRLWSGATLVDLGCGRGGLGLWLARALSVRVVGVDVSPKGIEIAKGRVAEFFPDRDGLRDVDRAEFRVGTFENTGLPDASADGLVSMDALRFTTNQPAALAELKRILKPGARAVFSATWYTADRPGWTPALRPWPEALADAGLLLEAVVERPELAGLWGRLFDLWEENEDGLRAELGDGETDVMLAEARTTRVALPYLQGWVYTVRSAD